MSDKPRLMSFPGWNQNSFHSHLVGENFHRIWKQFHATKLTEFRHRIDFSSPRTRISICFSGFQALMSHSKRHPQCTVNQSLVRNNRSTTTRAVELVKRGWKFSLRWGIDLNYDGKLINHEAQCYAVQSWLTETRGLGTICIAVVVVVRRKSFLKQTQIEKLPRNWAPNSIFNQI